MQYAVNDDNKSKIDCIAASRLLAIICELFVLIQKEAATNSAKTTKASPTTRVTPALKAYMQSRGMF